MGQCLAGFVGRHANALAAFGSTGRQPVCDDLKGARRYEPGASPTHSGMAAHCGPAVVLAGVRKPRGKAKVETDVQMVEDGSRPAVAAQ